MDGAIVTQAAQFGVAGLMAWMWLSERRGAHERERQLSAAHDRVMEQRVQLDALMRVVTENTRAVSALEAAQRAVASALERVGGVASGLAGSVDSRRDA